MKSLATLFVLVVVLAPVSAFALPNTCECVRYLREVHDVNIKGDAWTINPNLPMINIDLGQVLLLKYGKVYHAALIIGFEWKEGRQAPEYIWVVESNFKRCKVSSRKIEWEDPAIRGIYAPPPLAVL